MTKVEKEYAALRGITAKLNFDPSGRPGAAAVRAQQDELRMRCKDYAERACVRLWGCVRLQFLDNRLVRRTFHRERRDVEYWRNNRHTERQRRVDDFLDLIELRKRDIAEGSPRELFSVAITHPVYRIIAIEIMLNRITRLGMGWYVRATEDYTFEYRGRFRNKKVFGRNVEFRRINPGTGEKECRLVKLPSWRGNWLAAAVVQADLAPESPQAPLKIRLHPAYDARLIDEKRGYKIYSRTLAGAHVDYCIVSPMGVTYHDVDRSRLIAGLREKTRTAFSRLRLPGGGIDWKLCKKLGFCDAGIKSFCDAFGFDVKGVYSPEQIYSAVKRHADRAAPFLYELRALASAVGIKVPELQ